MEIDGVAYDVWVALRKESVDRNSIGPANLMVSTTVALRKESVDRNTYTRTQSQSLSVALRKESVDRNSILIALPQIGPSRSPQGERG